MREINISVSPSAAVAREESRIFKEALQDKSVDSIEDFRANLMGMGNVGLKPEAVSMMVWLNSVFGKHC